MQTSVMEHPCRRRQLSQASLCGAIVLAIAPLSFGDGVTIITHGYNPSVAGAPAWPGSLRDAIATNFLGGAQKYGTIAVSGSVGALVATCSPWNVDLSAGTNGDLFIVLDWSAVADHLTTHVSAQSVAAAVVDKIVTGQNSQRPLAELPVHLVGHSRGGGMVCELARLLGERGVVVDHLTPLDPHPLTAGDPQPVLPPTPIIDTPAAIYQNVVFADVYYQTAASPVGQYLAGAYNRPWTAALTGGYHNNAPPNDTYADHRNIVLLYQGTADPRNPVNNGEATMGAPERAAWFNAYENGGDGTGFAYSRLDGGGNRAGTNAPVAGGDAIRAGLNNAAVFGGGGARSSLTWSAAVWPNVAQLDVRTNGTALGPGTHPLTIGATQQLHYVYLDYDSGCTVTLHADADRNPYNGNDVAVLSTQVFASATGGAYAQNTVDWVAAGLSNGATVFVYARITDGTRTRYLYAAPALRFASTPVLTADAGAHGAIAPAGPVPVPYGGGTNFVVTPDPYWHVAGVATNGVSVGAVTAFAWSNVTAAGTIHADFAADLSARGTPHWWLAQYGLTNGGASFDQVETNNPDHDPFTTREEYLADSNPTNAASYIHVAYASNLPPWTVGFESSSNRLYTLEGCVDLVAGGWTNIPGSGPKMGVGGPDFMTDTNRLPLRFYRIDVEVP